MDTLTLFSKNLNQRSLTPRWPLTPCLLRSHVWLYPRIIVSKSHDDTSMYVDTVINFANYHIHTYTYYVHTTYYVQNEWSHSLLLNSVQARQLLNSVQARQKWSGKLCTTVLSVCMSMRPRGPLECQVGIRLVQKFTKLGLFYRTRQCTRVHRLGVQKRAKLEKRVCFWSYRQILERTWRTN